MRKALTDSLNQSLAGGVFSTASEAGEAGHTFDILYYHSFCNLHLLCFVLQLFTVEQNCSAALCLQGAGKGGAVFNDTRLQHPGHGEQQKQLQFCFIAHVHACARMEEVKSSLPV